jgi:beta-alanine degradation protein BauB
MLPDYRKRPLDRETSMNRFWKHTVTPLLILGSALAVPGFTQDRATVVPGMKVLLENDCVRVQYHDVAVGETVPMHSHPNYVVYTLAPFKARIRVKDGTERTSQRDAGEAYWNPPITHSVENLGSTPIHNLIIEMKPGGSCD